MDAEDGVRLVVLVVEQRLELESIELTGDI